MVILAGYGLEEFQHTAARRRLPDDGLPYIILANVSTHSRAEAAAGKIHLFQLQNHSFNTQPRGGGCFVSRVPMLPFIWFQHTAARRRLLML